MKSSRTQSRCFFNALLVLITLVIMITPEWSVNGSTQLKFLLLALWYVDSFLYAYRKKFRGSIFTIVLICFWSIQLIYDFLGVSTVTFGNYVSMWFFFDIIIKALYVKQYYDPHIKKMLLRILQIILLINILWNSFLGNIYEGIHMSIIEDSNNYIGMNVATTAFYNLSAFFVGFNMLMFFKDKKVLARVYDMVAIVLTYYFMFSCSPRLTSLFISILLLVLIIMCRIKKRAYRVIFGIFLCVLVICITFCMSDVIIEILPERVAVRLSALLAYEGSQNQQYLARFNLVSISLKTFTKSIGNFLFGVGYHLGYKHVGVIGQHSLIPDYLAAYGCIGLLFIVYFFTKLKVLLLKGVTHKFDKVSIRIFVFALFLISLMSKSFVPEIACGSVFMLVLVTDNKEEEKC